MNLKKLRKVADAEPVKPEWVRNFEEASEGMPYYFEYDPDERHIFVSVGGYVDGDPEDYDNTWMQEAAEADAEADELNEDRWNPSWDVAEEALAHVCENLGLIGYDMEQGSAPEHDIFYITDPLDKSTKSKRGATKSKMKPTKSYHPKSGEELINFVHEYCEEVGWDSDLNFIDTSDITDMSLLFYDKPFTGNVSKWDTSHVKYMNNMFQGSSFDGDIFGWDTSNVVDMHSMFKDSPFSGNLSRWDVSKVRDMREMFKNSPLESNPPKWFKS